MINIYDVRLDMLEYYWDIPSAGKLLKLPLVLLQ